MVDVLLILNEMKKTTISATKKLKVRKEKIKDKEKVLAEFPNPSCFKHTFPETGN